MKGGFLGKVLGRIENGKAQENMTKPVRKELIGRARSQARNDFAAILNRTARPEDREERPHLVADTVEGRTSAQQITVFRLDQYRLIFETENP